MVLTTHNNYSTYIYSPAVSPPFDCVAFHHQLQAAGSP
jgi:hypothetical protein